MRPKLGKGSPASTYDYESTDDEKSAIYNNKIQDYLYICVLREMSRAMSISLF